MPHIPTISRFVCPTCGGYGYESHQLESAVDHDNVSYDEYERTYHCRECGDELKAASERAPRWFAVAFYTTYTVYGGPEEGGWNYTRGTREDETLRVYENTPEMIEMMERYVRTMDMANDQAKKRHGASPLSFRIAAESLPDVNFPKRRPVYC